ncbi:MULTISPECIES: hypothetical protein [Streptomyces]|uniref:hypothetical protein n=1 Tax=Streptomyces TaxID=1883 RepID=UPI000CD53B6D|nr:MULTISPECIES: hypothetical protein [Streptomyces]
MKQATVKSIGAAALGAAFAVTAAGSASAVTDTVTKTAGDVLQMAPVDSLPVDKLDTLSADQTLSHSQVKPGGNGSQDELLNAAGDLLSKTASNPTELTENPTQLLGGLPLDSLVL